MKNRGGNSDPVISASGLNVGFPQSSRSGRMLFRGLEMCIRQGEILGLHGPSGIGKSTLGNVLLGLKRPWGGAVDWQGESLENMPPQRYRSLRPRYQKIHQSPAMAFSPRMTIGHSMRDVLSALGTDMRMARSETLDAALEQVGLSQDLLGRYPRQLSGGELQRFAVARALLLSPCFLVADEPTSRLDPSVQALVARLLQSVAKNNDMGMLFISHDIALLRVVCDRIVALHPKAPGTAEGAVLKNMQ